MQEQTGATGTAPGGEPELLGDYEILSQVGTGGMGLVYRARQRSLGRVVALKVIREEVARTPEYRARFLREPQLAASVDHPHVVSVYEVGERQGKLFLAMQWVDGEDLKGAIRRLGWLPPDRAVRIATQLARALDAVHSAAGLIHRDVKPANILIRQVAGSDHAYLTDFGVAKRVQGVEQLTRTGLLVGTPGYVSPEQIRGGQPRPESDLYALGCVFFEALTGHRPFPGDSEISLMWAHANDPRPAVSTVMPQLGERYDEFISIALAIDPRVRFGSGHEFANALEAVHRAAAPKPRTPPVPMIVGPDTPVPPERTAVQPSAGTPATPSPPASGTPPPPPYPPYGHVALPPSPPRRERSGSPLALIILGLVALAGLTVGALAAAGVFSHHLPGQTIRNPAVSSRPVASSRRTGTSGSSAAAPSPSASAIPSGTTSCGGGLYVGPNTSCGFAQNVEQAYQQSAGGAQVVGAFSPATGLTYTIDCTGGSPHVCTGGTTHDASIYFGSGSNTGAAASGGQSLTACDSNISVNSVTSCPFAENVFKAYAQAYKSNGGQTNNVVSAYSPTTTETYSLSCSDQGTTITCTGGNNSLVTFPLQAAQAY